MPNPNSPVFPFNVAQDIDLMVASNRAITELALPIDAVATQFAVSDASKFSVPCLVQIDTEIIRVGDRNGNILQSCTRGFANTASVTHNQAAAVKGYVLSYHHNQLAAEIKAIEDALGANLGNLIQALGQAGGDISGLFSNLRIRANGVTAGTYGGFNRNVVLTVDQAGRVTNIANATGNINYPIIYKGAILQGSNAVLGFSFDNTNAPNAVPYPNPPDTTAVNGSVYAVASFTAGQNYFVQDHFYLPDDWVGDVISLDIYWRTAGTTGNVTWKCKCGALRYGLDADLAFNAFRSITTTVPATPYTTVKSRITSLLLTGIQAGDEFYFEFARDSGDTCTADAEMISIKFNIHRDFSLVP